MTVFINKKETALTASISITTMLTQDGITASRGIAVAVNDLVVSKNNWASHMLKDGDKITIITATAGG